MCVLVKVCSYPFYCGIFDSCDLVLSVTLTTLWNCSMDCTVFSDLWRNFVDRFCLGLHRVPLSTCTVVLSKMSKLSVLGVVHVVAYTTLCAGCCSCCCIYNSLCWVLFMLLHIQLSVLGVVHVVAYTGESLSGVSSCSMMYAQTCAWSGHAMRMPPRWSWKCKCRFPSV